MFKSMLLASLVLALLTSPALASSDPSPLAPSRQHYQHGLFLQTTVGDLQRAIAAYDLALRYAAEASDGVLTEAVLLRRAECFRLLGQADQVQTTVAALRKATDPLDAQLGAVRYFPPESDFLLQVKLSELLAAPLIKSLKIETEIPKENLEKVKALLAFDPLKDLEQLTIGFSLADDERMPIRAGLIHLQGNLGAFQLVKLLEAVRQMAPQLPIKQQKIQGVEVATFEVPLEGQAKTLELGIAQPDERSLLLGTPDALESYLAALKGKGPGLRANPRLSQLVTAVPKGTTLWLAAVPEQIIAKLKKLEKAEGLEKIPFMPQNLPKLSGLMLTAEAGKDLKVSAVAFTEDAESTKLLADILRGLGALAQLAPVDEPLAREAIKSLSVQAADQKVVVTAMLSAELLAKAAQAEDGDDGAEHLERIRLAAGEQKTLTVYGVSAFLLDGNAASVEVKKTAADTYVLNGIKAGKTKLIFKREGKPGLIYKILVTPKAEK
jgi:hypothetical protein